MRLVIKEKPKDFQEDIQSTISGPISGAGYKTRNTAGLEDEYKNEEESLTECGCSCPMCSGGSHHPYSEYEEPEALDPEMLAGLYSQPDILYIIVDEDSLDEAKKKKKGDRCVRIAKRKYNRWPSAYASGAVVKCRQGKIWKNLKESNNLVEYEIYETTLEEAATLLEAYKPNFSLEKSQGLHGWFKRNRGKGWIDCRTGKPCGRQKAGRGAKRKYPACRPTKAQCNKAGTRRKKGKATISWKPKKDK
jgi:hypothetical protein